MPKFPKNNTLADGLIEKTSSVLDELELKTATDREKRRKTLNEVKLIKNISKNPQGFLEIIPCKRCSLFTQAARPCI